MKKIIEIAMKIRNQWPMNPRTRVQDDERKNIKKVRQSGKKAIKEGRDD